MKQIEVREGARRQHRAIALYAALQCWLRQLDGVAIERVDLERLKTLPGVEVIVPLRMTEQNVVLGDLRASADAIGTTPDIFDIINLELARGSYFNALQYERGMNAPICVAKGADNIAFKIREIGAKHDIPIVENPPLARALYATVEMDEEVPAEHYKAVAEVIGYIMRLRNGLRG